MNTLQTIIFPRVCFIAILSINMACFGANTKESAPEDLIRSLYRFHQPWKKRITWFGDKRTLSKYFDRELTALFLKDAKCEKQQEGVCNLDFDPIYDAQDFDEKPIHLQITAVAGQPDSFKVTFSNLGPRALVYRLTNAPSGWRISDIKYAEGISLKELLSQEIK